MLSEMTAENLVKFAEEAFAAGDDEQAALLAAELRQRGEDGDAEEIECILALRETADVLRAEGEWAHGDNVTGVAKEWFNAGFAPEEVREWLGSRTFRADAAAGLRGLGITPDGASAEVECCGYCDTVGYMVSNGDLSPEGALRAILVGGDGQ